MYSYTAFGLVFHSELELPSLPSGGDAAADVTITLGEINKQGLDELPVVKPFYHVGDDILWLHIPEVAKFLVEGGRAITVQPEPQAELSTVRLFLLGSALGALLHQRNNLVLHSNAVCVEGGCILVMGASGQGKSTLAAALHLAGHQVLTDDISVVTPDLLVQPGYPQIKLWEDSADRLKINTAQLSLVREPLKKYIYPLNADQFCNQPQPVKAMYILHTSPEGKFDVELLRGMNKLNPLRFNTYRSNYLEGLGLQAKQLSLLAKLAGNTPIKRLYRPEAGFEIERLVQLIKDDVATLGA